MEHSRLTHGELSSVATALSVSSQAPEAAPEGGLLGIPAKSLTPPSFFHHVKEAKLRLTYPEGEANTRLERFALQSVARSILPKSRTGACLRNRIGGTTHVGVKYSKARERATYANLQTCASVWACPCCAAKISEHRRGDLVRLVEAHRATGGAVVLVTRTFPHSLTDSLTGLLGKLAYAENKYRQGNPWKRIVARFGIVGTVRAVECTYGANGWHPHIHELVFLKAPVSNPDLQDALYGRWLSAATRAGFPPPSVEHGLDVRDGEYAAAYASKWGMESELTKWHVKKGKAESLTPFDLLRIALQDDEAAAVSAARRLFLEYAEAFKGKRQLVYSKGLRDLYDLAPELTDEEAAEGEEPDAELLGLLEPAQWKAILRAGMRGHLLEAINEAKGDWSAIDWVLCEALAHKGPEVSPRKEACNAPSLPAQ
jgi:hypothetical protein